MAKVEKGIDKSLIMYYSKYYKHNRAIAGNRGKSGHRWICASPNRVLTTIGTPGRTQR